ncbi:MAG: hypothetical protein HGA31_06940 [Candidatus Moranbacteria bacterium]|nr:hypothetical protein [Candidatus Moranbacteria bacterium]
MSTMQPLKSVVRRYLDRFSVERREKRESLAYMFESLRVVGMNRFVAFRNPSDGLWYGLPDLSTLDATVRKFPDGMPLRIVPDLMYGREFSDLPVYDHCPSYRSITGNTYMFHHVWWNEYRKEFGVRTKIWYENGLDGDWHLPVRETRKRIGWIPEQPLRLFFES